MKPIKIILSIVTFLVTIFLAYMVTSFALWNVNPATWSEGARIFTAGFGSIFAALAVGFVIAYNNN